MFISEKDVLSALKHHVWMSGNEIREEIYKSKGKKKTVFSGDTLYVTLYRLEEEGWVECRQRDLTPEQLLARFGILQKEYKLTNEGIRHRHESLDGKQEQTGELVPESS